VAVVTLYAMDGCALLAFLRGEPGDTVVAGLLADQDNVCRIHAINLCEVYYDTLRVAAKLDPATSQSQAQGDVAKVIAAGVELREDIDEAFWQMVGQFKVSPGKISLADCFALALAIRTGATLVTSDHEFDRIVPLGLCPILFIR
jgi:PIN domain nuclease of toxin-antitoxin system